MDSKNNAIRWLSFGLGWRVVILIHSVYQVVEILVLCAKVQPSWLTLQTFANLVVIVPILSCVVYSAVAFVSVQQVVRAQGELSLPKFPEGDTLPFVHQALLVSILSKAVFYDSLAAYTIGNNSHIIEDARLTQQVIAPILMLVDFLLIVRHRFVYTHELILSVCIVPVWLLYNNLLETDGDSSASCIAGYSFFSADAVKITRLFSDDPNAGLHVEAILITNTAIIIGILTGCSIVVCLVSVLIERLRWAYDISDEKWYIGQEQKHLLNHKAQVKLREIMKEGLVSSNPLTVS